MSNANEQSPAGKSCSLVTLALIATIISTCLAAIALIPAFGQWWLSLNESVPKVITPTIIPQSLATIFPSTVTPINIGIKPPENIRSDVLSGLSSITLVLLTLATSFVLSGGIATLAKKLPIKMGAIALSVGTIVGTLVGVWKIETTFQTIFWFSGLGFLLGLIVSWLGYLSKNPKLGGFLGFIVAVVVCLVIILPIWVYAVVIPLAIIWGVIGGHKGNTKTTTETIQSSP